jgi:hypothetical protein
MVMNAADSAPSLEELMPMDLFPYATHAPSRVRNYHQPFRRHKTLSAARVSAAQSAGEVTLYEFDFTTNEWNEIK